MKTTIHSGDLQNAAEKVWNAGTAERIEKVISDYIEAEKPLPEAVQECEISLTFAGPQQMAEINKEYRDTEGPTDVLSFAMWENDEGAFEPPSDWDNLPLGDIIVCPEVVAKNAEENGRATVFGYYVNDPERFGIVEFDDEGHVISVEEKPENPKSNYAITGLYFYDNRVSAKANQVKPSPRGELEITTLNSMYLEEGKLDVQLLGRGFAWLDTGTMDSLVEAADFVRMVEKRQGIKISAPEEIAYKNGWISKEKLLESAQRYGKSPYGEHLKRVADAKIKY